VACTAFSSEFQPSLQNAGGRARSGARGRRTGLRMARGICRPHLRRHRQFGLAQLPARYARSRGTRP